MKCLVVPPRHSLGAEDAGQWGQEVTLNHLPTHIVNECLSSHLERLESLFNAESPGSYLVVRLEICQCFLTALRSHVHIDSTL
jgi:hypothetical protein